MPTCADIANQALKRLRVIDPEESANPDQLADAMEAIQGLFDRAVAKNQGALEDYLATANYTAEENQIIRLSGGAWTITKPARITDEDRDPYDGSLIIIAGASREVWLYDRDLSAWVQINALDHTDECPLALRDRNGLAAAVAGELADHFGKQLSPKAMQDAARGRMMLSGRIGPEMPTVEAKYY